MRDSEAGKCIQCMTNVRAPSCRRARTFRMSRDQRLTVTQSTGAPRRAYDRSGRAKVAPVKLGCANHAATLIRTAIDRSLRQVQPSIPVECEGTTGGSLQYCAVVARVGSTQRERKPRQYSNNLIVQAGSRPLGCKDQQF